MYIWCVWAFLKAPRFVGMFAMVAIVIIVIRACIIVVTTLAVFHRTPEMALVSL
jgi:hypothetical protein